MSRNLKRKRQDRRAKRPAASRRGDTPNARRSAAAATLTRPAERSQEIRISPPPREEIGRLVGNVRVIEPHLGSGVEQRDALAGRALTRSASEATSERGQEPEKNDARTPTRCAGAPHGDSVIGASASPRLPVSASCLCRPSPPPPPPPPQPRNPRPALRNPPASRVPTVSRPSRPVSSSVTTLARSAPPSKAFCHGLTR